MRITLIILAIAGITAAQTIYKVTPGTKDNKIILSVENSSVQENMVNLKTTVSNHPSSITFRTLEQSIEKIKSGSAEDVEFIFDVNGRVDVNKTDTVRFTISGKSGSWEKEILIGYELPIEYKLEQNYPNPFNPETVIRYQLPGTVQASLKIFDVLGREAATLVDAEQEAGYYEIKFSAQNLASGIYFYCLSGEHVNLVKKMILLK